MTGELKDWEVAPVFTDLLEGTGIRFLQGQVGTSSSNWDDSSTKTRASSGRAPRQTGKDHHLGNGFRCWCAHKSKARAPVCSFDQAFGPAGSSMLPWDWSTNPATFKPVMRSRPPFRITAQGREPIPATAHARSRSPIESSVQAQSPRRAGLRPPAKRRSRLRQGRRPAAVLGGGRAGGDRLRGRARTTRRRSVSPQPRRPRHKFHRGGAASPWPPSLAVPRRGRISWL